MSSINERIVTEEIMEAFRDVPRPKRYLPEDFDPHPGDELDYLDGKTWLDIAGDVTYMTRFNYGQAYSLEPDCLLYLLPGYMLGVIKHSPEAVSDVTMILCNFLCQYTGTVEGSLDYNRYAYICDRLTNEQKRVLARWLHLILERYKQRTPDLYAKGAGLPMDFTGLQGTFNHWKHWL